MSDLETKPIRIAGMRKGLRKPVDNCEDKIWLSR
jgi:hypothetical protein